MNRLVTKQTALLLFAWSEEVHFVPFVGEGGFFTGCCHLESKQVEDFAILDVEMLWNPGGGGISKR